MKIKPTYLCDNPVFLLIIVFSSPTNYKARNSVRETWGSDITSLGLKVSIYFLLGKTNNSTAQKDISEEATHYGDIIQEDFIDSYNNLTLKSISMLKLLKEFCFDKAKYIMKTDDDMFINLEPLVDMLRKQKDKGLLVGNLICHAEPIRTTSNKWFTPKYMYSGKFYPNYLSGTGYVMSIDLVEKLFEAAFKVPIFHLEDIYITGNNINFFILIHSILI